MIASTYFPDLNMARRFAYLPTIVGTVNGRKKRVWFKHYDQHEEPIGTGEIIYRRRRRRPLREIDGLKPYDNVTNVTD